MKYYSFRYNKNFYEGIATAYCSECNLNCVFCYSHNKRDTGKECTPREVAEKLINIAKKRGINKCRISGGECTLDIKHLLEVIKIIMDESDSEFWMETNGIILGKNPNMANKLSKFPKNRLFITVSIKHFVRESFGKLTASNHDEWYLYPRKAVEYLLEYGCTTRVAFMLDWYSEDEIDDIVGWLLAVFIDNKGLKFETVDEELEYLDNFVDFEDFRKYSSVPKKKQEYT